MIVYSYPKLEINGRGSLKVVYVLKTKHTPICWPCVLRPASCALRMRVGVTCGADEDLQIVQGWRQENKPNYSALLYKPVIVLCNEEITTVKGKESSGRIAVAYTSQEVEVVSPPRDAVTGDEVWLTPSWRHPSEVVDTYTVKQASWRFTVNQDYVVMNGNSFWTVGGRKVETNRLHSVAVK